MSQQPERKTLTVTMSVTPAQAIALAAFFTRWNRLAGIGRSRAVSFVVDGDGNCQPECLVSYDGDLGDAEMHKAAEIAENRFDFDPVAWRLRA